MRRGRRWPIAPGARAKAWLRVVLCVMAAAFALDLVFPPPIARGRVVAPVVADKDGVWLRAFATPAGAWRLAADLDAIDPEFVRRLIAVEDARFYHHPGVDPFAMARATASMAVRGRVVSGGSTITMQTARLLEPRPRTPASKLIEMVRAVQIERRLTKREILELYLTLAPYGGNLEGVRAASRAYFQRDPQALSDAEMALLVALPQAPEARRPDRRPQAARAARDHVIARFQALGFIDARLAAEARAARVPGREPFPIRADLIAERLVTENPGQAEITSSIDVRLQTAIAEKARAVASAAGPQVAAAVIVAETRTRLVRASIGGVGWDRPGGYIDMTRAVRSPGSTLKPFIYALAFDDGIAAPDTVIEDLPRRFQGYLPENFDRTFRGEVRVADALRHSLNLPAVATLAQVGPARFEAALERAGARPRLPARETSEPGLALALGGVGMSLEELATLYAALGDDGLAKPLRHQEGGPAWLRPGRRLVSPDAAAQVLTILADAPTPKGRAPAVLMRDAPQIAFKTGTSYGYRDAWAIGVGAGHTVAVWVGRPDGAPRPGAMGRSDALPLLFDVFDLVGAGGAPVQRFRDPAAEPAPPALARFEAEGGRDLEIVFPPDGADVLVDAFGPSGRGLSLAAQGGRGALSWFAEGAPVDTEPTSGRAIWKPSGPGVHVVSVVDAQGRRARVSVRLRAPGA